MLLACLHQVVCDIEVVDLVRVPLTQGLKFYRSLALDTNHNFSPFESRRKHRYQVVTVSAMRRTIHLKTNGQNKTAKFPVAAIH